MEDFEMIEDDFYEVLPEEEVIQEPSNLVSIDSFFEGLKSSENSNDDIVISPISVASAPKEVLNDNLKSDIDNVSVDLVDTIFSPDSDEVSNNTDVLPENTIFSLSNDLPEEEVEVLESELDLKEKRRQKIITRVQFGLIIFLVFSASLVYFFGYDFFEPYIKID